MRRVVIDSSNVNNKKFKNSTSNFESELNSNL